VARTTARALRDLTAGSAAGFVDRIADVREASGRTAVAAHANREVRPLPPWRSRTRVALRGADARDGARRPAGRGAGAGGDELDLPPRARETVR